jgi:zinc protease
MKHLRLKTAFLIAIAMAVVMLAAPMRSVFAAPEISHFRLDNGLEVVVIPNHRAPVVTHMIWYRVGAADEPPGHSGIAHFLEHLMFKGTEKNPAGRFSEIVSAIGGQENAFTSSDYTAYFQRVERGHLKQMMELEADRMTGLVLSDEVVLPERDVVLEEQNQRVANNPAAKLTEETQAALYLNHPYGRPIIGWRHEIEKLDREAALAFYKKYYTPNNAVLVVAGDVTADEVRKLAQDTYGKVPRRSEIAPRIRPQEPEHRAARTATLADPRVAQPSLQRSYLAPSAKTAKAGESEALDVLAHILGSGNNSRLYRKLVVENPIAVNVAAWYQSEALDDSSFGIFASPQPNVTLAQLEAAIDTEIADVAANGVTADELEVARIRLVADTVFAQDSQMALARWYGVGLTTGSTVDEIRAWPDRIAKVTAEDVKAAARKWLDKNRSVTGYLVKDAAREEKRS